MHMYAYYAYIIFNHSYPVFYSKISDILSTTFTTLQYTPEVQSQRPNSAPWYSGILYMDHPQDHSLFGVGLSGYPVTPPPPKLNSSPLKTDGEGWRSFLFGIATFQWRAIKTWRGVMICNIYIYPHTPIYCSFREPFCLWQFVLGTPIVRF